ncbi:MAG: fasciclin domain-containing protein [Bacteroidota bacterium]|nr:fasciclin domain-containing protein [Bacteroidota bacterium]
MKRLTFYFLSSTFILFFNASSLFAQNNKMVGGAEMYPNKNIIENAVNSKDHTTLVAAVKAAGLVETLQGDGPFTVFAPTNSAFEALPEGTVETLLKPENMAKLSSVLKYHVVAGKLDSKAVAKAIKDGNGKASLTTVEGSKLTAKMDGKNVVIEDENGNKSNVIITDVNQSNGVIHVIDAVLLTK